MQTKTIAMLIAFGFLARTALATPSTAFWTPATSSCQAWAVPHITYDSYFRKGPGMSSGGAAAYPTDFGLTVGFLPFEKIQGELGYDMFLPSEDPDYINGKLCTSESSLFAGSPGVSVGIFGVGFKRNVTDYNVVHLVLQKTIPGIGGSVAIGAYHGFNKTLFTNTDGKVVQSGALAAITSPDIEIGRKGLRKVNFVADVQTGKNAYGAWGLGAGVYFAENVSLLTGPVFFFDKKAQPGGSDTLWSLQLDIDVPLDKL
jgi:hypothetical protein